MIARGILLVLASSGIVAGIAASSRVPYDVYRTDAVTLRLSWRARGEKVRHCRTLSAAEQANIPAHMRRTEECTERGRPYFLKLVLDDSVLLAHAVHAAGAREDRPVYVWYEREMEPGRHEIRVTFSPMQLPGDTAVERGADLEEELVAQPGDVVLATYDDARGVLQLRARGLSDKSLEHHDHEDAGKIDKRERE